MVNVASRVNKPPFGSPQGKRQFMEAQTEVCATGRSKDGDVKSPLQGKITGLKTGHYNE